MSVAQVKSWILQASILMHWQVESRTNPRPQRLSRVPGSPSQLTREWLTAAMCKGAPGAEVTSFVRTGGTSGSNFRERILLEYNSIGQAWGLPTSVFTKSAAELAGRKMTGITGTRRAECMFYSQIRPKLDLRCPVAYHSAFHRPSGRAMLLLEDLAHTRGATFGTPLDLTIDLDTIKAQLNQIAVFHSAFWNRALSDGRSKWLKPRDIFYDLLQATFDCEKAFVVGVERSHEVLPEELVGRGRALWSGMLKSLALEGQGPRTLSHCDVHLGNWFFTSAGEPGLYDWGTVVAASPGVDIAYVLTSSLTVADRRAWENELIQHYVGEMRARNVELTTSQVWSLVREQVFHAFFNWVFTLGVKAGVDQADDHGAPDMQTDEVCLANIERMGAALVDWGALAAVDHAR